MIKIHRLGILMRSIFYTEHKDKIKMEINCGHRLEFIVNFFVFQSKIKLYKWLIARIKVLYEFLFLYLRIT